jgi:hypothetical protein
MPNEEDKPQRSFKVEDRRRFSETGEARTPGPDTAAPDREEPPRAQPSPSEASPAAEPKGSETNFATFILSLTTQALAHLGEIPDPVDQSTRLDLEAARQIIDIIGMLGAKTRGNLDDAEAKLVENALYDLRMRYVERVHQR